MTTKRDYYDVLDVGKGASEEDIRKAFRKKAMEFHPDRNKADDASDRFKEVNEAYQVLSDPQRRGQYDRFGHDGVRSGPGQSAGGFDGFEFFGGFGDIFESFFGSSAGSRARVRKGRDLNVNVAISLEEAASGLNREIEIDRVEKCRACDGSRSAPGSSPETCANCQGKGRVRRAQRGIFGQFVTEVPCSVCRGTGEEIKNPCPDCKGAGRERNRRRIAVAIPAGVFNGAQLNLRGQGDAGEMGGPAGDLYVSIRVKRHELFERQENDILLVLAVNFPSVALGDELEVPTLDGPAPLKIPPGSQSGETLRMKGRGMPHLGRSERRGDQLVTLRVKTPTKLSKRQRDLLEKLRDELRPAGDP